MTPPNAENAPWEKAILADLDGLRKFAKDMRDQGIHVGLNGFCCVDDEPWPCSHNGSEENG